MSRHFTTIVVCDFEYEVEGGDVISFVAICPTCSAW